MKKIICLLFTFQLIILSIYGIDVFQSSSENNMLYKNTTSVVLNFNSIKSHSDDFGNYFNELADKNNVSISRYVFKNDNDIVIYTSDTSMNNSIKLTNGHFPSENSNEFLSNTSTDDVNQCGTFSKINPKTKMVIKSITNTNNFGGDGLYYINTVDPTVINNILDDLNENVADAEIYSSTTTLNSHITTEMIGTILLVSLCVLAAIVHYSVNQLKAASIMRVNGFSNIKIINMLSRKILKIMLPASIGAYAICSVYYICMNKLNYFGTLSVYFIGVSLFSIAVSICVLILVTLLYLKKLNETQVIKGRKPYGIVNFMHYGLKIIFVLFLLFSISQLIVKSASLNTQLENLAQWDKAKNLYTTSISYTGENNLALDFELNEKKQNFYNKMNNQKDAFVISADNYETENGIYEYELNCENVNPETAAYGKNITINENYLKNNNIESCESSISEQIINSPSVLNILVPEKLKNSEDEIKENYLDYFYFQKVRVNNIYYDELGLEPDMTNINDLDVNIIYVKNNQQYFSYKSSIEADAGNVITDPIAVIYTANVNNSFASAYLTSNFYFYSDSEDPYQEISSIISECELQSSIQKVNSVYDNYGRQIQQLQKERNMLLTFVFVLFISSLIVTYNITSSYYEKNKYKLYIKKLFGYSSFRKNKLFILSLLIINIIPAIIASILNGISILTAGIVLVLIELLMSAIMDKLLAEKSFNNVIKGEH